jgi:hypothetical protein
LCKFLSFFFFFLGEISLFSQNFNYTTLEIKEKKALLHSMQIIIELKEMDETKITPFQKTQKILSNLHMDWVFIHLNNSNLFI